MVFMYGGRGVVELMKMFFLICGCIFCILMRFYSCKRIFEFAFVFIRLQRGELSRTPCMDVDAGHFAVLLRPEQL